MTGLAAQPKQGTATTFTVTAFDTFGNVATGYIGPATVKSSDLQATLPSSQAFSQGVANNISVTFNTKGTQTVTVTDAFQPTMTVTGSVSVQSNSPFAFCGCGAGTAGADALGLFGLLAALRMSRRRALRGPVGPAM
jgi:pantoate kinase